MIELIFTVVFFFCFYLLEGWFHATISDLSKYCSGKVQPTWNNLWALWHTLGALMDGVVHLGIVLMFWWYGMDLLHVALLLSLSLFMRVLLHDGFVMWFRGLEFCKLPTVDWKGDYWDRFLIWIYKATGLKPCWIWLALIVTNCFVYIIV